MKKLLKGMICASLLILSVTACGSSSTSNDAEGNEFGLLEDGVINAVTSPEYPPFEYLDGEEIVGFDIELLNAVAEISGLEVKYTPMEFNTIISAVQSGQYDVGMSAFTATEERAELVLFGDTYFESAQVALVSLDSGYTSLEDLEGKKLGAGLGTTGEPAAYSLSDDVTLVNSSVGFPMLISGQIDAYICDSGVAQNAVASGGYAMIEEPIAEEKVSMAFNKNSEELCEELNKSLAIFMESEEYTELLVKYELDK